MLKNFSENVLIAGVAMVIEATLAPVRMIMNKFGGN